MVPGAIHHGSCGLVAIDFVRANGEAAVPDGGELDPTTVSNAALTMIAQINLTSNNDQRILSRAKGFNDADIDWHLGTSTSGTGQIRSIVDGIPNDFNMTIPLGSWHQLAATFDGSNIRLYWDAVLVKTVAHIGTVPATVTATTAIGAAGNDIAERNFDGLIDYIGMWARALEVEELLSLLQFGRIPRNDIYCCFGMRDEGPGQDLTDENNIFDIQDNAPSCSGRRVVAPNWPTFIGGDVFRHNRAQA